MGHTHSPVNEKKGKNKKLSLLPNSHPSITFDLCVEGASYVVVVSVGELVHARPQLPQHHNKKIQSLFHPFSYSSSSSPFCCCCCCFYQRSRIEKTGHSYPVIFSRCGHHQIEFAGLCWTHQFAGRYCVHNIGGNFSRLYFCSFCSLITNFDDDATAAGLIGSKKQQVMVYLRVHLNSFSDRHERYKS